MTSPCDDVELFVDGELLPEQAEAFRQHLPDCPHCQQAVADLLQLKLLGRLHTERGEAEAHARPPRLSFPARWRPLGLLVSASLSLALVVAAVRLLSPVASQQDLRLARHSERRLEARLSFLDADHYRPPASALLGGTPSSGALPDDASLRREAGNHHAWASTLLETGDPGLARQALLVLQKLRSSPSRESDRAAALLLMDKPEEALRHVDTALAEEPRHPQALWNRGLALGKLHLPFQAARTFKEAASLQEPGWAREAMQRAEALERSASERRERWNAVRREGQRLIESGPDNLPLGFSQAPVARLFLYDAVRSASSREEVLKLLPLARELDTWAGGNVLEGYVNRVAASDFSRRAPLARKYKALFQEGLPAERRDVLLAELLECEEDDILLGALVQARATSRHLELFEAKAAASGDPWFRLFALHERAMSRQKKGEWTLALQTFLDARRLCSGHGLEYRCLALERDLAGLYLQRQEFDAAREHAENGWRQARASNEWGMEGALLWQLAQVARFGNDASLARALYGEWLAREPDENDNVRRAHQHLADIALHELRVDEARWAIDMALSTGKPLSLSGAYTLSDIARLKPGPDDEKHLRRALEAARPVPGTSDKALATHTLGRFLIERDVVRGRALMWQAIQESSSSALEEDVRARRVRAYSFTSLILEAGARGAYEEALELFARERAMTLPSRCLLAVAVDSERTLLIVRGAKGELHGRYDTARRKPLLLELDEGFVPEALQAALGPCPRVDVLARPPLHGRARLLPREMAWSYKTHASAPQPPRTGPSVHLVVSDVELPPGVSLEPLNPWPAEIGANERPLKLSGPEATPSRVLAAMSQATEIDLVAHGILHESARDSYLQLAQEPEGSKLDMARVRAASLRGAPFVVLAACHAARTAYALDEPLSLPAAFLKAGARGVLAATVEIPDQEAAEFFNAVRKRMREGVTPAEALRDERLRWLEAKRGEAWLDSVLLFE